MASSKTTKRASSRPKPQTDPKTRLAEAALKRLAKTGWSDLTLASVAKPACVPLVELRTLCGSKPVLFGLILSHIAEEVTARYVPEPGTAHDRVFEVAMCWFDVLASHKKAVASLYAGLKRDPVTLLAAREAIASTASWLLTLAEADTGPALPLRALGLAAAIGHAVPAWLEDGPDLTKTMASLDIDLRRGETVLDRMQAKGAD